MPRYSAGDRVKLIFEVLGEHAGMYTLEFNRRRIQLESVVVDIQGQRAARPTSRLAKTCWPIAACVPDKQQEDEHLWLCRAVEGKYRLYKQEEDLP